MAQQATLVVGAYTIVRTHRSLHLSLYDVQLTGHTEVMAGMWKVSAPSIPTEWRLRCAYCSDPPSEASGKRRSQGFSNPERAIAWLRLHRRQAHPEA